MKALIGRSRVRRQAIGLQLDLNTTPVEIDEFTEYTGVICLLMQSLKTILIKIKSIIFNTFLA